MDDRRALGVAGCNESGGMFSDTYQMLAMRCLHVVVIHLKKHHFCTAKRTQSHQLLQFLPFWMNTKEHVRVSDAILSVAQAMSPPDRPAAWVQICWLILASVVACLMRTAGPKIMRKIQLVQSISVETAL